MTTTMGVIGSANDLLAAHSALITHVRHSQQENRRQLHLLHSPPHELLRLPLILTPPLSPLSNDSPPSSPIVNAQQPQRPDLPPAKRARVARYSKYVPEEETIRNDYSQRYVDAGEWPQNWVLGAEPERRFEECALLFLDAELSSYSCIQVSKAAALTQPEKVVSHKPLPSTILSTLCENVITTTE